MAKKDLTEKAIDFKGKKYVLVADRVIYFNEEYPKGSITTELITSPDSNDVIIKATVKPTPEQTFTGYSQASFDDTTSFVNKTSALENAETSAVGRALAFMGIGVIDSIASIDEIKKTTYPAKKQTPTIPATPEEARKNAELAIEKSDLLTLVEVEKNINKSKILTEKDKQELGWMANERREALDPLKD